MTATRPANLRAPPVRARGGDWVDDTRPIAVSFDGRAYTGLAGDTLASALLANGVRVVGRSLKYHRPRGILSAGFEEPNALVQLGKGAHSEPNALATRVEIYDGMTATSVNRWPSLSHDVFAAFGLLARFMPAGFYYKTFLGSRVLWDRLYEPFLRRMAGFGRAPVGADPENYDQRHLQCDVLVVGGGVAGLASARAACASGARVVLIEDNPELAAGLAASPAKEWIDVAIGVVKQDATVLTRTTVFGAYDAGYFAALQRASDHLPQEARAGVRQRLWLIRAKQVVLATGAIERPLVFPNNDRPGVYLAGAARAYLDRFGVLVGRNVVAFTNNDETYATVIALKKAGAAIAAIVDVRANLTGGAVALAKHEGIRVLEGYVVVDVRGRSAVRGVTIAALDGGRREKIACDALLMSGGWSPAVHLFSQQGGKLIYDPGMAAFVPDRRPADPWCAGALCGETGVDAAITGGWRAGSSAATALGKPAPRGLTAELPDEPKGDAPLAFWRVPVAPSAERKCFIDFQNDSTLADVSLAVREGFTHPEHVKRYTLTGFGTDQGKTGNINALGNIAERTGGDLARLAPTTFRPPFLPVTFGALAGREKGALLDPVRVTALHDWHVAAGAAFENVGQWKRPWYYPKDGETLDQAVTRECLAVRNNVGILDASTLGKIEIVGADAAAFLNRVYTNAWSKLGVGRSRYGLMCREDGMLFDDGTTTRLAPDRFLMTTTTGNAAAVLDWLEEWLQTEWPDLKVYCTSVTDHWSTIALAGPRAREVLQCLAPGTALDAENFPFMSYQEVVVAGVAARVFRISFTGELSFEINVPWHDARHVWEAAITAGAAFGITPYGTEAMHVLRAEKGYPIIGQDTDGTVTPLDLGMAWAVSTKKDFLGKRSLARPDTARPDRKQFVGLLTSDPSRVIPEGAQIVSESNIADVRLPQSSPVPMEGHVTSSYFSAVLGRSIALALVRDGFRRTGETVYAVADGHAIAARIGPTVFYDPDGTRRDG
ncbi:MAG: sarcosine oxidase subunit alpha family protein [Proteobacteria bacterium]|nr:sarcosine oxidase subunit alpha family protein [Pseudomonadota bacterium]